MATVNGVNYAKAVDPSPGNIANPGVLGGKVRCITDTYTFAGEVAGTIVNIGQALPKGAIVVGIEIANAALGAGVTLVLGDAADDARYSPAVIVCTAAGHSVAMPVGGMNYAITGTNDTVIKLKTGVGAATGMVKVNVFYAVE